MGDACSRPPPHGDVPPAPATAHKLAATHPPTHHACRLPVHMDGSCNGLQHYAALGRDEAGGRAVNLLPSDAPQDVYKVRREPCEAEESACVFVCLGGGGGWWPLPLLVWLLCALPTNTGVGKTRPACLPCRLCCRVWPRSWMPV